MSSASQLFSSRRTRWSRGTTPPPPPHHHRHGDEADGDDPHGRLLRHRICDRRRLLRDFVQDHNHHTCEHELDTSSNFGLPEPRTRNRSETGPLNSRTYDLRFDRNDRLPGTVLQARARLLERLRGSLSTGTRQRVTPDYLEDAFTTAGFQGVNVGDWALELALSLPELATLSAESTNWLEQLRASRDSHQKHPGLSCKVIDSLERETFRDCKDDAHHVSPECSICLETFLEGDDLIRLQCSHRFHPPCLIPWLRSHTVCPNCRNSIGL